MSEFKVGDRVIISQQLVNNAPPQYLNDGSVQAIVGQGGHVRFIVGDTLLVKMDSGATYPFFADELIGE